MLESTIAVEERISTIGGSSFSTGLSLLARGKFSVRFASFIFIIKYLRY